MPVPKSAAPRGIFISYARSDGLAYSRHLRERFQRELPEFPVWRDIDNMAAGRRWWPQIEEALRSVECMVLLLTPGSLKSAYTTREWRFCRQNAVAVVPVLVPDAPLTDAEIPPWMKEIQWFDLENPTDWDKFKRQLRDPPKLDRVPFMAPGLPDGFVERPREYDRLVEQVLRADGDRPLAITTALHGAGGFGKTTLATRLCQDDRVVMHYVDGILWVTLGEKPNVLAELSTIYAALTGDRPGFGTDFDASVALSEHLEHRRCLLVIDDVWDLAHLQPFLRGGPKCTRLLTTRQINIAAAANCDWPVLVDEMQADEATTMLGLDQHPDQVNQLAYLARRLGEWPLMLELGRGLLRKRMGPPRNESFDDALRYVNRVLDRRGVTGLKVDDNALRKASVTATMDISLEHLDSADRQATIDLAVFAEDVDIPPSSLEALWRIDDFEAEERIDRLADSSLVHLNSEDGTIRLHDVVREYLATKLTDQPQVHARLIDSWGKAHELPDRFAWQWYGYHLLKAGWADRLQERLLDPTWLEAKLWATHPNELIADAERWLEHFSTREPDSLVSGGSQGEGIDGARAEPATAIRLIRDAVRLSSHLTAHDPEQFPGQLVGRLTETAIDNPTIADFNKRVADTRRQPCLLPRNSILNQAGGPLMRTLQGHSSWVTGVCVTPDGQHIVSASEDQTLKVWDLQTGQELRTLNGHSEEVTSVCVTPDGRHAVSASWDKTLKVWDLRDGQELRTLHGHTDLVNSVFVTPDGRLVVSASDDQTLKVWDLATGQQLRSLHGHSNFVRSAFVTPDGGYVVSASDDQTLKVWDLHTGEQLRTLRGHSAGVSSVYVTPDGQRAISASYDKTLKFWDLNTCAELRTFRGHSDLVNSVFVTPDGRHAISASDDQTLKVWDLYDGQELRTLQGHSHGVTSVVVTPDGQHAVSASDDRMLKIWNLQSDQQLRIVKGHRYGVTSVCVTRDGRHAVSASWDQTLKVWDLHGGQELRTLTGHSSGVTSVCVTPDGHHVVSASWDQSLKIWDLHNGQELRTLQGHRLEVTSVCVTPDGRRAVSASGDQTLKMWDLHGGQKLRTLKGHSSGVNSVLLTPCGRHAVSASNDRTLKVWDLHNGQELITLRGHTSGVTSVCATPDGRHAVSASDDQTLKVWDLETGRNLRTLEGHSNEVKCVCMTPDGGYAVSASDDQTLKVWNVQTGRPVANFTAEEWLAACAVSPDGHTVLAGEFYGRLHFLTLAGLEGG